MVIMGGGYDSCEDADPPTRANPAARDTASTCSMRPTARSSREFTTDRGVIGDVFVILIGQRSRQVGVRGGSRRQRLSHLGCRREHAVRVTDPASWTMTKIASLGCGTCRACTANRKFMFMPDVVELRRDVLPAAGLGRP